MEQWIVLLTDRELLGQPLSHLVMASGQRTARGDEVAKRLLSDARTSLFQYGWTFLLPSLPSQPREARPVPVSRLLGWHRNAVPRVHASDLLPPAAAVAWHGWIGAGLHTGAAPGDVTIQCRRGSSRAFAEMGAA